MDKYRATKFLNNDSTHNTFYKVKLPKGCKNAGRIEDSKFAHEMEVLIPPYTTFKLLKRDVKNSKTLNSSKKADVVPEIEQVSYFELQLHAENSSYNEDELYWDQFGVPQDDSE